MAKKRRKRPTRRQRRQTNWLLIGGIVGGGIILLVGLLFLSLQEPDVVTVEERCADNPDTCVFKGNPDAAVTLIEISDFGCPHCRDYNEETEPRLSAEYVEPGQLQYIVYPYALGPQTLPAAAAGLCADEQDGYFAFKEAMFSQFESPNYLSRDSLITAATEAGLNVDAFTQCIDENRYNSVVQENVEIARDQRINATPNFLLNGTQLEGAQPFSVFQQRIESFLN